METAGLFQSQGLYYWRHLKMCAFELTNYAEVLFVHRIAHDQDLTCRLIFCSMFSVNPCTVLFVLACLHAKI